MTNSDADKALFFRLVEDNKAIIFKICHAYCPDKTQHQDLAQEIIYHIWKSGHSFDPEKKFTTWMYRVALNVAISFYRKQSKEPDIIPLAGIEEILAGKEPSDEKEEKLARLQQLIHELRELDRALILLYLESKTYREIADVLGITETNVASKISRIKEKLKQKILR
jgi:RNA polymerase sigma factor (sigma-70 family)